MFPRRMRALLRVLFSRAAKSSGLWFRALICWLVGLIVLLTSQQGSYDLRFNLRGQREVPGNIVLVEISRQDPVWQERAQNLITSNDIRAAKEIIELTDAFFWSAPVWESVFTKALRGEPKAIVVTLFFSTETVRNTLNPQQYQFFSGSKIYWAAKTEADGSPVLPTFASAYAANTGLIDLPVESDGRVRSITTSLNGFSHLAFRVARSVSKTSVPIPEHSPGTTELINFQGPANTYPTISFQQLYSGRVSPAMLKDKILVFGLKDLPGHVLQTPLGPMTKAEVVANALDNYIRDLWITRTPFWLNALYLSLVFLISLWLIFEFPQTAAFAFIMGFVVALLALSAGLFDLAHVWLTVESPLAVVLSTYIVFTGYRLSETEKARWQSDRERDFLAQLEHLKTNFISLISHDLKTPIAKIQGIADRLLATSAIPDENELKQDLSTIRKTSDELRQYIVSILNLTRVEARDIKLRKEVVDFNDLVEETIQRVTPLAKEKNIVIRKHLEPLFSMELDRTLIGEVVLNLVENAIKYTDAGGWIEIITSEVDSRVSFQVTDNGGGIHESDIEKVFTKFYRGNSEKTMRVTGTGLGLYLVKYFIELHGGRVFIESRLGVGTKIGFSLPLEQEGEMESYVTQASARAHR